MEVRHFLLPDLTGIDDCPKTVRTALGHRNLVGLDQHPAENFRIPGVDRGQRRNVLLRDDENMNRPLWLNVLERQDQLVFIDLAGWNPAVNDLAEQAVAHLPALREAFSSIPEMPSRRRISCDTSSIDRP